MTAYTRLGIAMVALLGCAGAPGIVWAADPASKPGAIGSVPEPSAASIKGQVLTIEPDVVVLATEGGGQVRLKLTKDTKMERAMKVGDKVEADIGPDHQAVNLKVSDSAKDEQKGTERK
jgi:hypothetical protein